MYTQSKRKKGHTGRDRLVVVCASLVGVRVDGRSSGQRRGHVQQSKGGCDLEISSGRVSLVDDINHGENTVVADDIGLDGSQEVDSSLVLAGSGGGNVWDREVGAKVGRELGEEGGDAEVTVGRVVDTAVDSDGWFAEETSVRFLSVRLGPDVKSAIANSCYRSKTYVLVHRSSRTKG
jgi:hypothetical protein